MADNDKDLIRPKKRIAGNIVSGKNSIYEINSGVVNLNERIDNIDSTSPQLKSNRSLVFEKREPFAWSGTFPYLATTSTNLLSYLALTVPDASHIWQCEGVPTIDVGSLATADYDFVAGTAPAVTTDPDYRLGVGSLLSFTGASNHVLVRTIDTKLPSAMDGTKSLIVGGVMQWDSLASAGLYANIITQYKDPVTRGWAVFAANSGAGERKLRAQYFSAPGFTLSDVTAGIAIPYGTPFAWLLNIDFATSKFKIMTSLGGYSEVTLNGTKDFDNSLVVPSLGYQGSYPGVGPEGFTGLAAQVFAVEYDAAIDIGLSQDNMTSFLKFADGYLTV